MDNRMTDLDELKAFVKAAPDPSCAHMDWPGAVLDLIERVEKAESELSESGTKLKVEWALRTNADARIRDLEAALKRFTNYFIRAESEAGYMVVNEDETGFSDMREALIAVVFNEDDAQEFLGMVGAARTASRALGERDE